MKNQLQTFTKFAASLLPHETRFLLYVQKFKDPDRLSILKLVDYNAQHISQFTPYDTKIDKRKYNHLKNWIQHHLESQDVDHHITWLLDIHQKILTDSIVLEEEKVLLKYIRSYNFPTFYFSKFYEVVRQYRHFLLIRLRYDDHEIVNDFLNKYKANYKSVREMYDKLHQATEDIVRQYTHQSTESKQWESYLSELFYNEKLPGHLRYLAFVRIVFIGYNYRKYEQLRDKFDYLNSYFEKGSYYSKRHLANYYNNRLMLHSHFREYEKAVYYGHLAIRAQTYDQLLYVNNLCAVLLRIERHQEALELMKKFSSQAKKTKNFHNRLGYVSFYMESLIKNGFYKNAESYGQTIIKAYRSEVLRNRWHLFFKVYLESMMYQNKFSKVMDTIQKFKLLDKDKKYSAKFNYLPAIPLYYVTASYLEGFLTKKEVASKLKTLIDIDAMPETPALDELVRSFEMWFPRLGQLIGLGK